jgi:predicted nucleic acid-binding protein
MPDRFVLDSFSLMALFQAESGGAKVREILDRAREGQAELFMTVVNLGEVLYTVENRQGVEAAQNALAFIDRSPIQLFEVERSLSLSAARLKAAAGIGYLDCFAAALAQRLDAAVVTGDPDFHQIEHLVAVEWLPTAQPQ